MNLADKYRPRNLEDVAGQATAVTQIRRLMARSWGGRAYWLTGSSGVGKTTIARIIAAHGADELGINEIDATRLTPAALAEIEQDMRYRMLGEKPGKAYICNECHGLRRDTIRQLLILLEELPEHVVWIFTTTTTGQQSLFGGDLSGDVHPLMSRCTVLTLATDTTAIAERAKSVAMSEGIDGLPLWVYRDAVIKERGNLRAVLNSIESGAFQEQAEYAVFQAQEKERRSL